MKPVLTFDCDGVLAGGHYIPAWDRYPETYAALPLQDAAAPRVLDKLAESYNIYFVSGRRFPGALDTTRRWMANNGIDLSHIAGVIVGQPRLLKAQMAEALGAALHFDDDPKVVEMMGVRGVRYKSAEWPGHEHYAKNWPVVASWSEVETFIRYYFESSPSQMRLALKSLEEAA